MRAVIQRVSEANVVIDGKINGAIGKGLVILLGVNQNDDKSDAQVLAEKISKLRIFSDEEDRLNRSLIDEEGEVLVISNFTLYANYKHGNRPDYFESAKPPLADELYNYFVECMKQKIGKVETGIFGADMKLTLTNDGPVTIVMDSEVINKEKK